MSKYQPLADHLAGLSADEWRASFAEVEAVLGFPLPKTASASGVWWSNEGDKPHKQAWLAPGWRVADIDRRDAKVVFERAAKRGRKSTASIAVVPAVEPEPSEAGKPNVKLLGAIAGAAAMMLGFSVAAARLLRRK